jgi:micrococcal nuclease
MLAVGRQTAGTIRRVSVAVACAFVALSATADAQPVERVVDGDTIVVQGIGKVRLIGVDTPELGDSRPEVEQMARAAADFVQQTAGGKVVRLDYDWQRLDRYGRTLAYVYLPNGRMLNTEIIRAGFGFAYTKYPFKYQEQFPNIEREAREGRRGLWGDGLETARPLSKPVALASADVAQASDARQTVYVTRTGKAYHRAGCRSLSRSQIPIPLADAAARYRPCSNCKPPVPGGAQAVSPAVSSPPSQSSSSGEVTSGRCQAITKKGTQCLRRAKAGSQYCWQHGR